MRVDDTYLHTIGIVAVIKSALMLERGFILPNYDFKKPNEKIPFAKWHLKVRRLHSLLMCLADDHRCQSVNDLGPDRNGTRV